jgi:putative transposase
MIQLVDEAVAAGARQFMACAELGLTTRTLQRWKQPDTPDEDQRPLAKRPEPQHKLTHEEKALILKTVNQPEHASKPPSQIVPILADRGEYIASESSFYRVMREFGEQNYRGRTQRPENKPLSSFCATAKNQVWSWDITYLNGPIKGLYYYLYLILDIFTRDIVGWEVWEDESAEHASHLIRRAVMAQNLRNTQGPLILHSDNGSPMKGATMLATLYELGVTPSRSRPRVSNDNPYSESIFKTFKYRPEYPTKGFSGLEDARNWCLSFVRWYRQEHRHSRIQFITPGQHHSGQADMILENRRQVYADARARNPLRWRKHTRPWILSKEVWLNKPKSFDDDLRQLS